MIEFKCPKNSSQETKKFMESVLEMLNTSNTFENCDLGALRMLALSYEMYKKASDELMIEGPIILDKQKRPVEHPANKITKNYYAQLISIMKEFGLTMKSRERIKSLTPAIDEDNPLLNFLRNEKDLG